MKRLLLSGLLLCLPNLAYALDPIVNANADLVCGDAGGETFYPYGDVWAFLPGGGCKGTEPTAANGALEPEAAEKTDVGGHCIWVSFDKEGPTRKSGNTGTTAEHAERARRVVFGAMRKWAGYRMGQAHLGGDGLNWYCPATNQPLPSDTTKPITYTTKVDYNFGAGLSAQPTFNFFRGPDIEPTLTDGSANRGDTYECYAECDSGQTCAGTSVSQGGKTLFPCTTGKTKPGTEHHKVKKVRHNVVWVKGANQWKTQTGAGPEVLASTEVVFWQDTGVIISADMLFNNENQDWQFHDPANPNNPSEGCDNPTNCYFMETVATHEAGHFIGFGHVNCSEAVMVPSAATATKRFDLSKHEAAGVCSVYRPSTEGRYPTTAREGDGCVSTASCGAGNLCLFSRQAFFQSESEIAAAPTDQERFPHRGVCVKATGCSTDTDCDPTHGRVCQETTSKDEETKKYCLSGSPNRARGTVADYCAPCTDGTQCNSICAATAEMGITLSTGDTPVRICTAKCDPAVGCASGFTCSKVGPIYACVPNDPTTCINSAVASKAGLNEDCTQIECAAGLECFPFSDSVGVCLEACSKTLACKTPGYGCLFKLEVGEDGKVKQLDEGACFKKEMKEGDNCALSTNAMCGLGCTGSGVSEVCTRNDKRVCIAADLNFPNLAKCYTLCSANLPCNSKSQTCAAIGNPAFGGLMVSGALAGVCDPPATGLCLKGIGETCAEATECDTGLCTNMGDVTACTQYCDVNNRSGCPTGTDCVTLSGKNVCKPNGQMIEKKCGTATIGCNCSSFDETSALETALVLAALFFWRRRRGLKSPV